MNLDFFQSALRVIVFILAFVGTAVFTAWGVVFVVKLINDFGYYFRMLLS